MDIVPAALTLTKTASAALGQTGGYNNLHHQLLRFVVRGMARGRQARRDIFHRQE